MPNARQYRQELERRIGSLQAEIDDLERKMRNRKVAIGYVRAYSDKHYKRMVTRRREAYLELDGLVLPKD